MPELPEVEACRQLASKYCSGKTIVEAQVAEDDSEYQQKSLETKCAWQPAYCKSPSMLSAEVIEGIAPVALQEALQGRTIKQAHRKGKHMWLEFDQGPCLMLHFGKPQAMAAPQQHELQQLPCSNAQSVAHSLVLRASCSRWTTRINVHSCIHTSNSLRERCRCTTYVQ